MSSRSRHNPWLHRFALLTALSTLALIGLGGVVTSKGVGMAVPDWPTTYGYNMFLFPVSYWVGGIFYEHTHRLLGSFVGLLTTILAIWLWMKEERRWLRWMGVAAFFTVSFQGLLGGLRVTLFKDEIGIFHATLAQLFFLLICMVWLCTTAWWNRLQAGTISLPSISDWGRCLAIVGTVLIFLQLILGATMRHQHAGLAVPDFPLAYGKIWPQMDPAFIQEINQRRIDSRDFNPITAFQIGLHMVHRLMALAILACVTAFAWSLRSSGKPMARLGWTWLGLIVFQAGLGAVTVWSNKAADIATAHVVLGAVCFALGTMLSILAHQSPRISEEESMEGDEGTELGLGPGGVLALKGDQ